METVDDELRRVSLYVPNFNYYVTELLKAMTPQQKELLPTKLRYKIFKNKDAYIDDLRFEEKLFILSVGFKRNIIIVTEAEDGGGIGIREFRAAVDAQRGDLTNSELLATGQIPTAFVQGDKELMKVLIYLNHVYCSPIFELIKEAKQRFKPSTKKEEKFLAYQRSYAELIKMMTSYESNKKAAMIQFGITLPQFYALMYFYDGERFGKELYTTAFRQSYVSGRKELGTALKELYDTGMLNRRGDRNTYRYSITAKGMQLLKKVMDKLLFNYS